MSDFDETTKSLIDKCWPSLKTPTLSKEDEELYKKKIKSLIREKNVCLIAHYYVDEKLQELARETGGLVGDSLHMAEFGSKSDKDLIVVCGVRFMGESAKILSPQKKILMPTLEATCSLDLGCPVDEFRKFCKDYPERKVVVYVNTSAEVKACADWTVTSRNALPIINHLNSRGEKIIWAPDKHLGSYLKKQTSADMIMWDASCVVHDEFKAYLLEEMKKEHPGSIILAHPESPMSVLNQADVVGSTASLLKASYERNESSFIVATDAGIFAEMKRLSPNKKFVLAPTAGSGATCRSCGHCPWMGQNILQNLADTLENENNEIKLTSDLINKALVPLKRMMNFKLSEI